ncbi:MAG: AlkZ family DNA glycosylase [Chitinophagaceae bacterium]|nr:AlkZ family DNA glycosylase [Chitinophagaceae bacterium]
MTSQDIAFLRLFSQQITGGSFTDPAALVKWMGCIRAEDFTAAKWAVGHRVQDSTDNMIERALNEGRILWSYVLQPVKHFVSSDDIRWMLALTAPRLKMINQGLYRSLGIGEEMLRKSRRIMTRALEKGHMTRTQLSAALKDDDIEVDEIRLGLLLMDAELDGLICSGSMEGRTFTYTLLEDRARVTHHYDKAEAIAELARRYFLSRGPATTYDFSVWSGLRPADVGRGMEMNKRWLGNEMVGGQVYWFDPSGRNDPDRERFNRDPSLFLLPAFDELTMAYPNNRIFRPAVVIDGQVSGSWTYTSGKGMVKIKVTRSTGWSGHLNKAMQKEAERYSAFLGKRLILPPA